MELAHSLLLNEDALAQITEAKRPVFIFEWLRFLDKVLVAANKVDVKEKQKKLVEQLTGLISSAPGPPTRKLLAKNLATLYSIGDTFTVFQTLDKCNDIIKSKDDTPAYLPTKLAAVACVGAFYEKMGRMLGSSFPDTINNLLKALKSAESQGRGEILLSLQKVLYGLGGAAASCHRDIYKNARSLLTDRSMAVRCAVAKCLLELQNEAVFMWTTELENVATLCYKALEGSNYGVRVAVAKLLGTVMATALLPKQAAVMRQNVKRATLEEVLELMATGFLRGGSGFLKSGGEMLKGGGSVSREVRVGITQAYVVFVTTLGGQWLERNFATFLSHVLDLVSHPRATQTHVEAVYSRRCVSFMLRATLGGLLGEKAQIAAGKELCQAISKQMRAVGKEDGGEISRFRALQKAVVNDISGENKAGAADVSASQHVMVCALKELGSLVQSLSATASPLIQEPSIGLLETVTSVLLHPSMAARLAAAWCLRCVAVALPYQLTPLLDRCAERINNLKSSPEAVSGYSFAMAALLGGIHQCPLGIPHSKGKLVVSIAEDLLRTAAQNSRLSLQRTQAGWLLLGALMTLGPSLVRYHLPKMLLLWRNVFPRSQKELEAEKARGDSFTWQVTLEGRAGALCAMRSFVAHCPELLTEDVIRRLMTPIECAMTMMSHVPAIIKVHGAHLKASAAMVRLRLYDILALLPPKTYEGSFNALLRELVAEFTLTDNSANTTTSLLRSLCHCDDSVLMGSWLQETDHKCIEDQLQPNSASGSGALEHDPSSIYLRVPVGEAIPGPLPLGVSVIDASVALFGVVFPHVSSKHRLQMLDHFAECIKQAKGIRQQAVQLNIFTAVLSALKGLAENKSTLGPEEVRKSALALVMGALDNPNPILRCAAGEALGRMAQVVGEATFIARMAQTSFDKLKSARDVVSRTGHSLALGCLHRYVGGIGSGQHLKTSVSILLALAQDGSSHEVQTWALHSLALIVDSSGPMYRGYVEPTLSLVLTLLLTVPPSHTEVHQCLGRCLGALITTVGPELQGNGATISTIRSSCLVGCAIMQDHSDSLVQAAAISCLQQLHMFAPRHVNLSSLVPCLCVHLCSSHLLLRRAAVACLRQLAQREAAEVCEYAMSLAKRSGDNTTIKHLNITETGLEGVLFGMLDRETDRKLCSDIHDTLGHMLSSLAVEKLSHWLKLCKDVLAATTDVGGPVVIEVEKDEDEDEEDSEKKDEMDDDTMFTGLGEDDKSKPSVAPRWVTRVFAADCLCRIILLCESDKAHFDLAAARSAQAKNPKGKSKHSDIGGGNISTVLLTCKPSSKNKKRDPLVLHLSDLIRMAFMAATDHSNQLRMAGLQALEDIIKKFASVPEPEFPGHVILEQYQANVGAALRPAFSPDTPSDITAKACQVCSTWIGSGVVSDLNDLRRVHNLLVSSLDKVQAGKGSSSQLYSESATTMEKLAVLKAWAEVYVVAMKIKKDAESKPAKPVRNGDDDEDEDDLGANVLPPDSLITLVQPELPSLSRLWLAMLRDYALLTLPAEFSSQLPPEGGAFYTPETIDTARIHYRSSWAPVLHAVALWLSSTGFGAGAEKEEVPSSLSRAPAIPQAPSPTTKTFEESVKDRMHLMLGVSIEFLCFPRPEEPMEHVMSCLQALFTLLESPSAKIHIAEDQLLAVELLNVLHRLLLTRDPPAVQLQVIAVVQETIRAAQDHLQRQKTSKGKEEEGEKDSLPSLGEGGDTGELVPGKSLVFAAMELLVFVLVRHLPQLNARVKESPSHVPLRPQRLPEESARLVANTVSILAELPSLCSPAGSMTILPTVLFLITGVLREAAVKTADNSVPVTVSAALQGIKTIITSPLARVESMQTQWTGLVRSSLASVLEHSQPDESRPDMDEVSMLTAITLFLLSASNELVGVTVLQKGCMDRFRNALNSSDPWVQARCYQLLLSVFQHSSRVLSTPYIHALAPVMVEKLKAVERSRPGTAAELQAVQEGIRVLENLVGMGEEQNRVQLLALLVPTLVSYLLDENAISSAPQVSRALHEFALQNLMRIGPLYPAAFKIVIGAAPELKIRLESAIRANQASSRAKAAARLAQPTVQAAPTIKLKTSFF
ncbi:HEAT repeat-containing protein 5B isoform X1 [Anarrhichthys ocellatus]|uniref:HEAT repeat-containing protein 5B isoform X1 n=1 Tax=Anarrhichthys ocellatus TaxID=433405 RepID=UPI0012ED3581|nr:HEAT repeat-containing protein 5B isoform X1 [Anarrhichthys ocellatus]XP_031729748.1 HEAT repeat-containing protein 5B isoform X1 [Anarrhichthys ocellatus]XP_031729756.1 HEAT repeat-containing protein 5B isoform X1 [Anarrhichthys ocellatus]